MSTNYIDQITDTAGTTQDIAESESTRIYRATCSTAASTAAKVATLGVSNKNFSLTAGVRVAVTFTYGNSAATPTLRVDGSTTGTAKTIAFPTSYNGRTTGNGASYNSWGPYETVIFTYDGTYWINSGSGLSIYTAVSKSIPTDADSSTTGITASTTANKTTVSAGSTIYGVQSTTTSVTGVQSTTTTASKVTVGSHSTDYGVTAAGSGSFTQGSFDGGGLTLAVDGTDSTQLNITFTAATHGADSHTHTAPTLGSKVPTVSASDVTVPIKDTSSTTVPIKNASSTSVPSVSTESATVSITDPGHGHTLS